MHKGTPQRRWVVMLCAGMLALLAAAILAAGGQAAGAAPPDRPELETDGWTTAPNAPSSTTQEAITGGQQEQKDDDLSLAQLLTEAQHGTVATATLIGQDCNILESANGWLGR